MLIRNQQNLHILALLNIGERGPLLVEQEGAHLDRQLGQHLAGLLFHRFFFDQPQHGESE